MLLKQTAIKYF